MSVILPNGPERRIACESALQLHFYGIVDRACLMGWARDEVLLAIADTADRALIDLTGDAPATAHFLDCPRAA
jgi:hypothetical protein